MHKVVSDLLRQRALLVSLAIGGLYDYLASAPQAPREQIPVLVVVFDNQYCCHRWRLLRWCRSDHVSSACPLTDAPGPRLTSGAREPHG